VTGAASQMVAAEAARPAGLVSSPAAGFWQRVQNPHAEQALFHLDLRRSLELHRRLAIGFVVFGLLLAGAYVFRNWPIYTAETLVYVQPTPSAPMGPGVSMHWPYNYDPNTYESYIQQQILSMTRPDVLKNALGKLGSGWQKSGESEQDAIDRLGRSVEATRVQNSYQVSIVAHASNAQVAADMANAVAAAYIEGTAYEQRAGSEQRVSILRDERERVKKELADDRSEQVALNAQLGVAAIGAAAPEHYDDDVAGIHGQLVKARADHDEAEARLEALAGKDNSAALNAAADDIIATDSGLSSLKTALDQRRAALVSQMANLTPNHPLYKQDAAELAKIDANIESATGDMRAKAAARVQEKLEADLERTAGVESRLNGELAQMTRQAAGATPKLQRAADLATDIARLQERYTALDEQLQNQMIEDAAPERAHVTNAAVPPTHPAENGVLRNAGVLFFGFSLLGLMAAVTVHKLDPHLYIASDVEQVLGFAPMAMLPDFREVSDAVAEEHLLRLSSTLEHERSLGHLKSCIFTGATRGTGTTTVANHVRTLLEGIGKPAVLVDAAGRTALGEVDAATRSSRSLAVLQQLSEPSLHNDALVITDAAPLTLSAETEYLARNADSAIVVMESGVTTRAELRAVSAALQRLQIGTVGFVLNRVRLAKADAGFRNSVRAVDQHLRTQSRPAGDEPVRTRRVEFETTSIPSPVAHEAQVGFSQPEQAPAVAIAEAPRSVAPAPLPAPVEETLFPAMPTVAEAEKPWWLADPVLQAQKPVVEAKHTAEPEPPAAYEPAHFDDSLTATASRLSGLRNIFRIDTLGAEPSAAAPPRQEFVAPPSFGSPAYSQDWPVAPAPSVPPASYSAQPVAARPEPQLEPVPAEVVPPMPSSGNTRQVTTVPEFLPPRKTRPSRWESESGSNRDREDAMDDVAILPSWRGQYRRKN
jgi:polysaccharide biosynthesis transport protein